ncbi:PREDICTED: uncharacterized protein C20orf85 homolog isoform X1 [Calidris pugnax]|uniref:uncharacterized protein C20orf85 homolog isoform X1 n=1 Tax=Calidris pugnax TaxID=198806 RepID=UPI00071D0AAD|nr:PREDICTED: uncharacterized protein C20orf85 homolog isoform X1 [Calidris pugnax]
MAHRRPDPAQSCNFVARDNCWKKLIESELEAAKRWSHKWGFLKTPLEELTEDEKKENTKPKIQLPEHLQVRPVTPVEKYIKVNPSPPVPKTTQGFIGWRSAVPGLELERGFQIQSCKARPKPAVPSHVWQLQTAPPPLLERETANAFFPHRGAR